MTLPALIASDVDGTLLDDDEKISARTRAAVHAAVDAGAQFVLATGRPPRWVRPVVDALGLEPMAVCANGAVIYDPSTDRIVSARTLSADVLGELAEIATRVIPGAGLAVERVGRSAHDAATPQFVSSPGYEHAWLNPDNTEVSIEDLLTLPRSSCSSARPAPEAPTWLPSWPTFWYRRRYHLLHQQRPAGGHAAGHQQGHWRRRGGAPQSITAEDAAAFGDMPNDVRCCGGPATVWRWQRASGGGRGGQRSHRAQQRGRRRPRSGTLVALERSWLGFTAGVNRSSCTGGDRRPPGAAVPAERRR